ncbi:uncharacterized protein LOC130445275 [Diorhabda sublineata]|uniref:uncharacterized protein LOC130445275 n=1 Tax=Diorhabda sublineata TaxID=1163346 RepID=UPI0024E08628|nr:uncharacterized protein LOC130445275 [Diorhabda sublineata]
MNNSIIIIFFGVCFLDIVFNFSLNPAGHSQNGDPAPGRSPGPPIFDNAVNELDSLSNECRLEGIVKEQGEQLVNLTLSHELFETNVLVPDITYQVILKKYITSSIDFIISSSFDGDPFGEFSTYQDCGPHIVKSGLTSEILYLNWTFHPKKENNKSNVTFMLEYSPNRDPFVTKLIYVIPIRQECQLQLTKNEAELSNHDLPHMSTDCQVWFPSQNSHGYGIIVELTRLNVPCTRGYIHFSGLNNSERALNDTTMHPRNDKQTILCGKLEELSEVDRHVYFPASSVLSSTQFSHTRPTMHLKGKPIFSILYRLVDYCYNVTFFARNGSFELQPKEQLQCSFKIHLPYGNRVALNLWPGNTAHTGFSNTAINFQDIKNDQEKCDGLLIQLQDGNSFWTHCTKPGDEQRQIEIVSRENKVILKVTIRRSSANSGNFGLKMSYRAEPVESVVGVCEFGWIELSPFCIGGMGGLKLPWAQAESECNRKGGHLVSVTSKRHQQLLDNLIINSPDYNDGNAYWIGASDKTNEGDFKWSDGSPFSYTNWFPGWAQHDHYNKQPNDDGLSDQDCIEVRRNYLLPVSTAGLANTFMWNDRDCSTSNHFICERLLNNEPLKENVVLHNCNKTVILSRDQPRISVSSPGFPRQYPDNANCFTKIIASSGYKIILDFEELVLEDEKSCSYDFLQILEAENDTSSPDNSSTSSNRLCGDWSSKLKLLRYVSKSSSLKLRFSSDYSHHFGGFKIRISMENAFQCADDRFSMFNNSCYLIVSYPEVTWNTSQQICQGMKANLASVLSSEEERFIISSIRKTPEYRTSAIYWLGATSTSSSDFEWIDDSPMTYTSWLPGLAPTDNDLLRHVEEMTCLSIQWTPLPGPTLQSGLYWKVHRCEALGGYICKKQHQVMNAATNYNQTINGTEGSITSPNYPNNYYHNLDLFIRISGPDKTRIVIKFIHIHIESQLECLYDYIELKSVYKHNQNSSNDIFRLCGNHERDMDRFNFVSETNEVDIKFHTDYSISDRGFSLIWYTVDVSACPLQTLTATEGTLTTPNYPDFLLAHLDCTITILAPTGKRIWLEFFTGEGGVLEIVSQSEDFNVEIMLGQRLSVHRLFETSTLLTEGSFVSKKEKMKIKLHTGHHPLGSGFRASYRIISVVKEEKTITLGNYTSGLVFHLNYPDRPPSNTDFTQHFIAPLGSIILLELYNVKLVDADCIDRTSFLEIFDNYSDINGTTWRLCYDPQIDGSPIPTSPIYISSYLNTIHLRQVHGPHGIPLNGTLKVQFDANYKTKLINYKDREVESCNPNPCENGGKCIAKNSTKFCQCTGYYTGLFCALTKCELDPCAFGTCELAGTSYKCHCKQGYVGIICEQKRRPCEGNPCESRGICIEKGDSFQCQCHAWWEGRRCERRMLHIPYKPLSERMLHEPFWLGLMTVFVVMGVIGMVWCAKRHFPEKIEKLLAEEESRNRSAVSSLRSSSVREQLAAASGGSAANTTNQNSGSSRSLFGRLGIRKPSILSLTSPHASSYEAATARTFSLDDLLKPPLRRTPSPKKKRNNSTPTKKNIADKRQILQQLVSPKPCAKKVSLGELIQLSEIKPDSESNVANCKDKETKFVANTLEAALIDPKLEKKVTFARLLNKVSAEMSSGSEVELGIMQTNRLGCMFARPSSTPPSPSVDARSPNSTSSNQDLLINRRHNRLLNGQQKPASADSILAMFRNFSSSSTAANYSSSLKITPSTTPTASSPQDDLVGDDDSSTSSIHTPVSFSSGVLESPIMHRNTLQGTIEVPVLDPLSAHKSSSSGSNLLHPPTILLEIPNTINKCLSPIREMPTPLPSPMPSPALTPLPTRRSNPTSTLEDAELSDDRISVEIPNFSMSTDIDDDEILCSDILIDPQAEDGLILEEAAAMQQSVGFKSKNRPPPIGQTQDKTKPSITITVDPPPLVIPTLTVQMPSPTFPGSPPPHRASVSNSTCFQFPSPKLCRKLLKDFDKPTSLDLPCAPPLITITCNMNEIESDTESISPATKTSGVLQGTSASMTYLSPFSINHRGEHTASESNLSSSGYSSMASPGPSRCSSNNPLCPTEMDDQGPGGFNRRPSLTPTIKLNPSNQQSTSQDRGRRSDSETLSDEAQVESNDEGIGTDHLDEKIDEGELKSARELEVFMVNDNETCKTLLNLPTFPTQKTAKCLSSEDTVDRLLPPLTASKNSLQLPSIIVQCESPGCDKHLSPMSSRSESPLSDRTTGLGRFSPQFYGRHKDILPFTDSDGLYDFPSSDKVNVISCTHHRKPGRKREKKISRNCKSPSPTKHTQPTFSSQIDIPNKDMYKVPQLRKLSPKRRINRSQVVSSSSSSDSLTSSTKEVRLSTSSPSPDTIRWASPVSWMGDKREKITQSISEGESFPLTRSQDFPKTCGSHQKVSRLRAISHQIRFLRRLEQSLKKRERTVCPSDSFDSDDESPRATSPLLQPSRSTKMRKSCSIGKLQGTNKEKIKGRYAREDIFLPLKQSSLKVVTTGNGYSE